MTYDAVGNRIRVIDANQHPLTYTYDSLSRLTGTLDAENQATSLTYDALGNKVTDTDAEEVVTHYDYDALNRLIIATLNYVDGGPSNSDTNVTSRVVYNGLGWRTQVIDGRAKVTGYGYDALGRTVAITDALTHVTRTGYDGRGNRRSTTNAADETTTFSYDGANRLQQVQDHLGHVTTYGYNKAGERTGLTDAEEVATHYDYDALGRLTGVIENYVDGGPTDRQTNVTTRYGYDRVGNRTVITDARSITTPYFSTYEYDRLNRRTDMYDQMSHRTQYAYDAVGNLKVMTDANLQVTTYDYDQVNRLTGINYPTGTPHVSFTYYKTGQRHTMSDGTGTTTYTYDKLYRLTQVSQPSTVGGPPAVVVYGYDAAGNRTHLTYPNSQGVTYTYDDANRLDTVTDWHNGQFGYDYDNANRLTAVALPNDVESGYTYDDSGRLTLLAHANITETLASYDYTLDNVGNRRTLAETLLTIRDLPAGSYLESDGLVVLEAEHFGERTNGLTHQWNLQTGQSGYTGTSYLQVLPDIDTLYQTGEITTSPRVEYVVDFTTPTTYTVWLRGFASNAAGDSVYVGLDEQLMAITGFAPGQWDWASTTTEGLTATLAMTSTGVHTLSVAMREDGLRIDRLLLTTDTTYLPLDFGPVETERFTGTTGLEFEVDRVIDYDYDHLYHLTSATYSTGELYTYEYDPVGNRLQQIIDGDTTSYQYDAANRLAEVDGQSYTFDANGNLLTTGAMTNTWDAANRLVETSRQTDQATNRLTPIYNGVGDRVGQTVGLTTTTFALDVQGLPEVIYTSESNAYLHLPGVIMTENTSGDIRYLLSDGLGSVRQAVDDTGAVVAYHEFDPYGNPVDNEGGEPYGYTGEWWEQDVQLLHLRARWYSPYLNQFISPDPIVPNYFDPQSLNKYAYGRNNPVNLTDPSGMCAEFGDDGCWNIYDQIVQLCPECAMMTRPTPTGNRKLHEETTQYLRGVLDRVQAGWRPHAYDPDDDPLTPEQWRISKLEAQRFQIPVELVAGTVAVEIVHDTDLSDPVKDQVNTYLLLLHFQGNPCATGILDILENYEGRGPGPGVTNFHTGTAKNVETHFQTYYPNDRLLEPPGDDYTRQLLLLTDALNIRYAAAYLRMLADIRKGNGTNYALHSHLSDLTDVDMQIIYGAFRAGVQSWGRPIPDNYQQAKAPGGFSSQIRPWLYFYRDKAPEN